VHRQGYLGLLQVDLFPSGYGLRVRASAHCDRVRLLLLSRSRLGATLGDMVVAYANEDAKVRDQDPKYVATVRSILIRYHSKALADKYAGALPDGDEAYAPRTWLSPRGLVPQIYLMDGWRRANATIAQIHQLIVLEAVASVAEERRGIKIH
jgi:hypothetical protein